MKIKGFKIQRENQLTYKKKALLKQGTKVKFKWHGSNSLYIGRIELNEYGDIYFINENCFENDKLKYEELRYYNTLASFFPFTYFEILN